MRRLRLVLEYDGTDFHGWQFQEGVRTVEGCLQEALTRLSRGPVETAAASRTDSGVHALGQCVLAVLESDLEICQLGAALNSWMPPDLAVRECQEAEPGFHPRHDSLEKRYLYQILNRRQKSVFSRAYSWWVPQPLEDGRIREAARHMVGEHDFAAFSNRTKDAPENSVRRMRLLDWQQKGEHCTFQVIGSGFLYRMVRNLVGTLVEVGRGRLDSGEIPQILRSRERQRGGPTAPPQGLYLMEVSYPGTQPCTLDPAPLLLH
ncbi:MAG: tRNA pseudouridine(38-40) synthase TruA [Planctomycetota bacterium]